MKENNSTQDKQAQPTENVAREGIENEAQENRDHTHRTDDTSTDDVDEVDRFIRSLGREWLKLDFVKRSELAISVIGIAVLVFYTIFTALMYEANKASADTTQQILIQGTRPWVGIDGAGELKMSTLQIIYSPQSSDPDHPVKISISADYVLRNTGNSIARREFTSFLIYPFPKSGEVPDNWRKEGCEIAEKISVDKSRTAAAIFPGATVNNSNSMTASISSVEVSFQEFWISGCVVYQDPYGTLHHTKILYRSVTDTTADPIVAIQSPKVSYPPIKSWQIWDTDAD